jgi:hypothetical protein
MLPPETAKQTNRLMVIRRGDDASGFFGKKSQRPETIPPAGICMAYGVQTKHRIEADDEPSGGGGLAATLGQGVV